MSRYKQIASSVQRLLTSLGVTAEELPEILKIVSASSGFISAIEGLATLPSQVSTSDQIKISKCGKKPKSLPELPQGFAWPTEKYAQAHRDSGVNIIRFLEDPNGWFPLIQGGLVDLRTLRMVDASAAMAVNSYTKPTRKRAGRKLPSHLDIPVAREVNDRALQKGMSAIVRDPKLAQVLATRLRKGIKVPGLS